MMKEVKKKEERTDNHEEWSDERREERNDEESPNFFSPVTTSSTLCGHNPDEGVVNATIRLSPLFVPSHLFSSSSFQHSNSFPCPTATPQTSPSSPQFLLNNHSFCSTLFNICQITFFSTYAPCIISKKSYAHHICSIYAPCNSSTILPHALNQNNNALCFPLPSPMPKFENHLCLYAYAPLFSQYAPPFRSSPSPTKKDTILHHHLSTSSSWMLAFKTFYKKHGLDCADAILNGRVMLWSLPNIF